MEFRKNTKKISVGVGSFKAVGIVGKNKNSEPDKDSKSLEIDETLVDKALSCVLVDKVFQLLCNFLRKILDKSKLL